MTKILSNIRRKQGKETGFQRLCEPCEPWTNWSEIKRSSDWKWRRNGWIDHVLAPGASTWGYARVFPEVSCGISDIQYPQKCRLSNRESLFRSIWCGEETLYKPSPNRSSDPKNYIGEVESKWSKWYLSKRVVFVCFHVHYLHNFALANSGVTYCDIFGKDTGCTDSTDQISGCKE